MVLGIDEAGRGPVIGPLVIAGVQVDKKDLNKLKEMGVKDSKLLSPRRREELAPKIKALAKNVKVIILTAKEIDELREKKSLNQIELEAFAEIIREICDSEVFLDLPEPGRRWIFQLKQKIPQCKLTAEHKADVNYPIVGAASIIAKVTRDAEVRKIEKQIGLEIRSGYPADPHVILFLRKWLQTHKEFPDFVRKSWITAQRLVGAKTQKALVEYRKKRQKKLLEFKKE